MGKEGKKVMNNRKIHSTKRKEGLAKKLSVRFTKRQEKKTWGKQGYLTKTRTSHAGGALTKGNKERREEGGDMTEENRCV